MSRRLKGTPGTILTPRQREIAALVCEGLLNKGIGARMGIRTHTVAITLSDAYARAGVTNRTELAVLVIRHPETLTGERSDP